MIVCKGLKLPTNLKSNLLVDNPIAMETQFGSRLILLVLGQDGKVLFIKYANYIRRVPLDRVVPADEYVDNDGADVDQDDVKNHERMHDDSFDNEEIVAQKDIELENLKKMNHEQPGRITELERKVASSRGMETDGSSSKRKENFKPVLLPKLFKGIKLKLMKMKIIGSMGKFGQNTRENQSIKTL